MKQVVLLRSQDIVSDSRVLRWEEWFKKEDISYTIVGWDRAGKNLKRENTDFYRRRAGFQQGMKGIIGRVWWNLFLLKYLFSHHKQYQYIHACDFDTVIPGLCMKIFGKKVIFDIFDWFSDEVRTGKIWIDKPINILEKWAAVHADLVIICEKERLKQMGVIPRNYIIIPNIPEVKNPPLEVENNVERKTGEIRIAYVGGLVKDRGLIELINVVQEMPRIKLEIAGFGDTDIVRAVEQAAHTYENIQYDGKVPYEKALEIMGNADLLYAMYYKTNPNHIYAAPNKFYESLLLQIPLITTEGTLVGNKVKCFHNGYVIMEGEGYLAKFLSKISIQDIKEIKRNMPSTAIMDDFYRGYQIYMRFLNGDLR